MTQPVTFKIVLRGYNVSEVDAAVGRIAEALSSDSPSLRASIAYDLSQITFPVGLRGYDRGQVDEYLDAARRQLG